MGMYDTVLVPCPECYADNEFQSKSGACSLAEYTLQNVPADVLPEINNHAPVTCVCGHSYSVPVQDINWANTGLQAIRVVAEIMSDEGIHIKSLARSMDLEVDQVEELLDRICEKWDYHKENLNDEFPTTD
jgi:hypothetical protein